MESKMSPVPLEALRSGKVVDAPRVDSLLHHAHVFLCDHGDEAWRAHELAEALDVDPHTLGAALRRLRARGLVGKQGPYWFALSQQESAQLQAAMAASRAMDERHGAEDPVRWARLHHA